MPLSVRQLLTLAGNGFVEILREPVYLVLLLVSVSVVGTMPGLALFAFGEEQKLVIDSGLAMVFVIGLAAAGYHASSTLSGEIRRGTALVVLAKPVGRLTFLLGKFLGLTASLGILVLANLLAGLLMSKATLGRFELDSVAIVALYAAVLVSLGIAGVANFLFRRPFCSDAALLTPLALGVAFALVATLRPEAGAIPPGLVRAYILVFLGLTVLGALALGLSTRLDVTPTLSICTVVFLVGLMTDYWFGRIADSSWLAFVGYAVVPNWQQFWAADALREGAKLPWSYVGHAAGYAACYSGAALAAGAALFRTRELG
jgi:ABC-type transport system involved in multi-copper enzyme maturation permease subunit